MSVTIELTDDEETRLRDEAARRRQAPEDVAHGLVRDGLGAAQPRPPVPMSPDGDALEALDRHLLVSGLMAARPARPGQLAPFELIAVRGEPVSETLVRERR